MTIKEDFPPTLAFVLADARLGGAQVRIAGHDCQIRILTAAEFARLDDDGATRWFAIDGQFLGINSREVSSSSAASASA